jgi:hypothetical protein
VELYVIRCRFLLAYKNSKTTISVFSENVLGFDLNEVFDDLVKFNFDEKEWQLIQPIGDRPVSTGLIVMQLSCSIQTIDTASAKNPQ